MILSINPALYAHFGMMLEQCSNDARTMLGKLSLITFMNVIDVILVPASFKHHSSIIPNIAFLDCDFEICIF